MEEGNNKNTRALLEELGEQLPHFADGRIDYSAADRAAVLNCFVTYEDKILLLRRSDKVRAYKNKWNSIGGYLDDPKVPLKEKVTEELREEIGVRRDQIAAIKMAAPHEFFDEEIGMTWIIHPVRAVLKQQPRIFLDWEHTEYAWIDPQDLVLYDTVPALDTVCEKILAL